jgi:hypothetical protein
MHKVPLNIRIPSPLSRAKTHPKQRPLRGQSLLDKTYDDYFNMEEVCIECLVWKSLTVEDVFRTHHQ